MNFNTPVLFLIFNRPKKSLQVFEKIRDLKPRQLFIAADGPRAGKEGEAALCEETRKSVMQKLDWPCEVKTLFREQNVGCKVAVSSGISWFFENVEAGIILEDDCVPSRSFFEFCEVLLARFKDDNRVMHIAGTNFVSDQYSIEEDYYFSVFANIWGWATWRRAWKLYDVEMKTYPEFKRKAVYDNLFPDPVMSGFFKGYSDYNFSGKMDNWDLQWVFTVFINNGLCAVPRENLISNIGFGEDATHTTQDSENANRGTVEISFSKPPLFFIPDRTADTLYFDRIHGGKNIRYSQSLEGKFAAFIEKFRYKWRQLTSK